MKTPKLEVCKAISKEFPASEMVWIVLTYRPELGGPHAFPRVEHRDRIGQGNTILANAPNCEELLPMFSKKFAGSGPDMLWDMVEFFNGENLAHKMASYLAGVAP